MTNFSIDIDLDKEIDVLLKRYEELRKLRINPQGPSAHDKTKQRLQISFLIAEINQKIALFEFIYAHRSPAIVVVNRPTQEEIDAIQTALDNLDKIISREQSFEETVKTVTTILEAADTVNAAAKSG